MFRIQRQNPTPSCPQKTTAFLVADSPLKPVRVAVVLLEHFSLMSFTAIADVLTTANLVSNCNHFEFSTFALDSNTVESDLKISISVNGKLDEFQAEDFELLVVCGGYRCSLMSKPALTTALRTAARSNLMLGGIWNGSVALAQAGLLDGYRCAAHLDNHAYLRESFSKVYLSDRSYVVDGNRFSCAGPHSAMTMMLTVVDRFLSQPSLQRINDILNSDLPNSKDEAPVLERNQTVWFPASLQEILELMDNNIDEPLSIKEIAGYVGIGKRQIQRLFLRYLDTSPSRYYLERRLTHARQLLTQSSESVAYVSAASGFTNSSHFSNCFRSYFGISPSQARNPKAY